MATASNTACLVLPEHYGHFPAFLRRASGISVQTGAGRLARLAVLLDDLSTETAEEDTGHEIRILNGRDTSAVERTLRAHSAAAVPSCRARSKMSRGRIERVEDRRYQNSE